MMKMGKPMGYQNCIHCNEVECEDGTFEKIGWIKIIPYFCTPLSMFLLPFGWYFLGNNSEIMLLYVYIFVPIMDLIFKDEQENDSANLTNLQAQKYEKDKRFLIPLYTVLVVDFIVYFWAAYIFSFHRFGSLKDKIMFLISAIHCGNGGMVAGHELLHRKELMHKLSGTLFYFKCFYSHYFIEHTKGHHIYVATKQDPATSWYNESLYHFLPRTVYGSYKSVWKYESERLSKRIKNPADGFSMENRLISFNIAHLLFIASIGTMYGSKAIIFAICYAIGNIFFLETTNYIEHYGLLRVKDKNGLYESISMKHSWNAPQRYSNYMFFKLQSHSDHHANQYKPYQILNNSDDCPILPNGYTGTSLAAIFPPIWFKAMNPLVKALKEERKPSIEEKKKSQSLISNLLIIVAAAFVINTYLIF